VGALKLAPLADATGGVILLLEDFGESFFENLSAAVRRPVSDGAIFTVRASAGVGCARVIGAVEALSRAAATMATAPSLPSGDSAAPAEDAADAFRMKSRDLSQVRHPICSASSVRSVSTPSQEPGALMCAHGPRVGRRLTSKHNQPATSLFLGGIGPNCVDTSRCVSPQGVDTSSLPQIATGFELNFRATLTLRFTESRVWSSPLAHGFIVNATPETTLRSTRTSYTSTILTLHISQTSQSVAVFLEYAGDVEASHVHLQFVAWFPSKEGGRVARCMTRRLPVAPSKPAYLRGVDSSVAAILAAKKAALDAQSGAVGPKEACARVEARVLDVADVFTPRVPDSGVLHDPFPRELGAFAEAMYHLLRGPMLGTLAGHEDERAAMRQLFLGAGEAMARSMLVPRLYVWRGGDAFEEVPPADLALRSVDVLVLDHGTDVFVWVGHGVAAHAERLGVAKGAASRHAATLAAGRFPVPKVRTFREGSSQARYMVSRLMPLHRDAPHEQDVMFPPIRSLSPNERKALTESFLPTDDFSFSGWMRQLGLAAPLDGSSSVKLKMMSGDDTSTTASSLIL
jgi:hypothetical protein